MKLNEVKDCLELPRERMKRVGVNGLEDFELLAIILSSGTKNKNVLEISKELLSLIRDCSTTLTLIELKKIEGIGEAKAMVILSFLELASRLEQYQYKQVSFDSPLSIFRYFKHEFISFKEEHVICLYFDSKLHLLLQKEIAQGSSNQTMFPIKELFMWAVKVNANQILLMHNHPSNDVTPSIADIESTNTVKEACKLFGMILVDHMIIGKNKYYSFLEHQDIT